MYVSAEPIKSNDPNIEIVAHVRMFGQGFYLTMDEAKTLKEQLEKIITMQQERL